MRQRKIVTMTFLLLILSQVTHVGVAGECNTPEDIKNSRKSMTADLQSMQANLNGQGAKINQAFDDAALQKNWTPLYRVTIQKHILLSKQYAAYEEEKKSYVQELQSALGYFDEKTARLHTADACNQRLKITGVSTKINSVIDRQYDYVVQQIEMAKPDL